MANEHQEGIRPVGATIASLDNQLFCAELLRGEIVVAVDNSTDKNPKALFLVSKLPDGIEDFISVHVGISETITTNTTLNHSHHVVLVDATAGAVTVTLPASADYPGKQYTIKKIDNTNNVVIDGDGSETIDGATTVTLSTQYNSRTIQSNGSNWFVIASV